LAAGLRPDQLEELKRSPDLLAAMGPTSKGRGGEGGKGGEGIIHLLLPQAHTAVAAYAGKT